MHISISTLFFFLKYLNQSSHSNKGIIETSTMEYIVELLFAGSTLAGQVDTNSTVKNSTRSNQFLLLLVKYGFNFLASKFSSSFQVALEFLATKTYRWIRHKWWFCAFSTGLK